ncbi:MAG: aldo/keto reductase [Verrucomicrobia bacterium]|nr:aldo/keto reductase [Verrucomicrobiota bacterium]
MKETMNQRFGRREFLARATQAAATVALCRGTNSAAAGAETLGPSSGAIPTRTFGKTGLRLPILGYGGAGLPKVWGNPLSYEDRVKLVRYAYDRGIRYFDTAGNYMESQAILGEGLKGVRDKVCLNTKVETTAPGEVRQAVERSLQELQTDFLDSVQIHGTLGLEQMSVSQAMKIHRGTGQAARRTHHPLPGVFGAFLFRQGAGAGGFGRL